MLLLLLLVQLVFADDQTVPAIEVKGSTKGVEAFELGIERWLGDPALSGRPGQSAYTQDFRARVTTSGGSATLLEYSGDDVMPSSSATIGVSASWGWLRRYDASRIPVPDQVRGDLMPEAYALCEVECRYSGEAACGPMKEFLEDHNETVRRDWFKARYGAAGGVEPAPLMRELQDSLWEGSGKAPSECSIATMRPLVDLYASGQQQGQGLPAAFVAATEACIRQCTATGKECGSALATQARLDRFATNVVPLPDVSDLCPAGVKRVHEKASQHADARALASLRYWPLRVIVGLEGHGSSYEWLEDGKEDQWTKASGARGGHRVGFSVSSLPASPGKPAGLTLLGAARHALTWKPSKESARLCRSAGTVAEADGALESCKSYTLGAPQRRSAFELEGYIGWTRTSDGSFSVTPGFRADLQTNGRDEATHSALLSLPVTIRLAALQRRNPDEKLGFKGLLRATPFGGVAFGPGKDGDVPFRLGVTLELIGRSSLFSSSFDSL